MHHFDFGDIWVLIAISVIFDVAFIILSYHDLRLGTLNKKIITLCDTTIEFSHYTCFIPLSWPIAVAEIIVAEIWLGYFIGIYCWIPTAY